MTPSTFAVALSSICPHIAALSLSGLVRVVKMTSTLSFSAILFAGITVRVVFTPGPFAWVTVTVALPSAPVTPWYSVAVVVSSVSPTCTGALLLTMFWRLSASLRVIINAVLPTTLPAQSRVVTVSVILSPALTLAAFNVSSIGTALSDSGSPTAVATSIATFCSVKATVLLCGVPVDVMR